MVPLTNSRIAPIQTNLKIVISILNSKTMNQKEIFGRQLWRSTAPFFLSLSLLLSSVFYNDVSEKQMFCLWKKATDNMHF